MSNETLKPGQEVHWMHSYCSGRSINFSTRHGKIVAVYENAADVKFRGKVIKVSLGRLRPQGQQSQVTDVVNAMANPV